MTMKMSTGFTLIETMVAVTIITLAVAGPLFAANRAFVAARIARDQLTASHLAQEGIEYVRAMRDNEYLAAYRAGGPNISSTAWDNFIAGIESVCLSPSRCTLDPVLRAMGYGAGFAVAPYSGNAPLYLANGLYTQQNLAGGVRTVFTRTIEVSRVSASDERIVSMTSWNYHGTAYSVTTTAHLSPWQ
ncbi:MAG: hypothetical protein UY97_C0002G0006 [Parcubacteria group bacterium GW2011_GWB1_57_6]|nr:MAG: hypothetical protein UY93_C0003G0078 [Parcubacteria group bacterium GW2011_GWA1_56_13]KKW46895.1 MAG: hypothetical protein UY97_C0002G0006 [Parcubacteria group bacterium GW2011_GWB1_57_6]